MVGWSVFKGVYIMDRHEMAPMSNNLPIVHKE
jgi:hypothetical protein